MPRIQKLEGEDTFVFYCAGCGEHHHVNSSWERSGSDDAPTLRPSILVTRDCVLPEKSIRCHSFITAGRIQYLGDCHHELRGQTVDLMDLGDV